MDYATVQLGPEDERIVRMLAGSQAGDALAALAARPDHFADMSGYRKRATLVRDLMLLARLCWRIASSVFCGGVQARIDAVVCDYHTGVDEQRRRFFQHYRPGDTLSYVFADTRLTASMRGAGLGRLLADLAMYTVTADRSRSSELQYQVFQIAEYCLAAYGYASRSKRVSAYVTRLYKPHSIVLAGFLRDRGISVALVPTDGRVLDSDLIGPADEIMLTHPFQLFQVRELPHVLERANITLWGPHRIADMRVRGDREESSAEASIGLYTQGYWLRVRDGWIESPVYAGLQALEAELDGILSRYVAKNPEITAMIFPHPWERRNRDATGESPPGRVSEMDHVTFSPGADSISTFHMADVGLTTGSTVGFDRLYAGYKMVFYLGDLPYPWRSLDTPFRALIASTPEELESLLDRTLAMTTDEFFEHFFGKPLSKWTVEDVLAPT